MPALAPLRLTEFVTGLFQAAGVPPSDARTVAASLVQSNLRGHDSHGVMRVPQYVDFLERGDYRTGVELIVEHEAPGVVTCDAQWGFGQVQAHRLLDLVVRKAQAQGVAAGTARNCGHIGRLGEYAERAAAQGMVLIASVNNGGAGQRVAPPGGLEPRLGTNPLCAGVPTSTDPVVLDFGTSVAAEGKVRVFYINDKAPVPEGWLQDSQGRPTTDPSVLYEPPLGTILPMGGSQSYKGFGLGLVLDMLTGGLSGGETCHPGAPPSRGNNVLFLALDAAQFSGLDALIRRSEGVADYVRSTPRAPGVQAILLPGDPELRTLEHRSTHGIPLERAHWVRLAELAQRLGVPLPDFSPDV
ncbi:MAG: Ldh family oxidoreductase [Singulisphaera sp.]